MYYLYLGKSGSFQDPESLIVEYRGRYFIRKRKTDWDDLDESLRKKLLAGDSGFYAIEESQFEDIIRSWGGSKAGYRHLNVEHKVDNHGYGDEYDD